MTPTIRRNTRRSLDGWQTDLVIDYGTDDLPMEFQVVHNIMKKQELETAVFGEILVRNKKVWRTRIGTHPFNASYSSKICERVTTIVNAANEGRGEIVWTTVLFGKRDGLRHHFAIPGLEAAGPANYPWTTIIYENMILMIVKGPMQAALLMDTPSPSAGGIPAANYIC